MVIAADEYEVLRNSFAFLFDNSDAAQFATAETHPIACLDALYARSPAKVRQGLQMAINDMIEMTRDWPASRVQDIDFALASKRLPTLSQLRLRFSKTVDRILKRGAIQNEQEYYAARNALEMAADVDQPRIRDLVAAYEMQLLRPA